MRIIDRLDKYMNINGLNDNQVTVKAGLGVGTLADILPRLKSVGF
jgi:hypothetical protein